MAIKTGYMVGTGYFKSDNEVVRLDITDQAYRLYGYIASLKNGYNIGEAQIMSSLGWSVKKVRRYKAELVQYDLLYLENNFKYHRVWVGNTKMGAKAIRDAAVEVENLNGNMITLDDLEKMRNINGR